MLTAVSTMKIIANCVGFFGGIAGLVAAYYWHRSSKVPTNTPWQYCEPPDDDGRGWIVATMEANSKAATLNTKAAGWTAASVFLFTVSSILANL